MTKICPKCRHANPNATDDFAAACPKCGVIYAKVEQLLASQQAQAPLQSGPTTASRSPTATPSPSQYPTKTGKRKTNLFFVVIVLGISGLLFMEHFFPSQTVVISTLRQSSGTSFVAYRVSGTATRASITYQNSNGGVEQREVNVPWSTSLHASQGSVAVLSAQNQGESGTIIVSIQVDSRPSKTASSDGAYMIATISDEI